MSMKVGEVLEMIVSGLEKQGLAAIEDGNCKLRITDKQGRERKCALGMLIDDEHYYRGLEYAGRTVVYNAVVQSLDCELSDEMEEMLSDAQDLHDDTALEFCVEDPDTKIDWRWEYQELIEKVHGWEQEQEDE